MPTGEVSVQELFISLETELFESVELYSGDGSENGRLLSRNWGEDCSDTVHSPKREVFELVKLHS